MTTNQDTSDLTNQSIAGFSILHRLGVGGMSEVYLAFQESLHRHVALKVMRADFVGSSDHEQRFLQEARAVASLIHPNIVQVYDVGKFESVHYIAQEYVPGSNLFSYVQRRGSLPLAEAVSILWQTTAALQKAASIGLVHRDIKPDNILLTPDGEVKVADFGLARARGQSLNLTAVGVTLGSPLYMSPEQIQGLSVDSRSDLYSLGATAYHMLTGRSPFTGETALALAMQHLQAEPASLALLRPDLPQTLVDIVHKLMAKNPDDRFASAVELARALKVVVDESLAGQANQMVPFAGLIIEHQRISNLDATQALQKLTKKSVIAPSKGLAATKAIASKVAFLVGALLLGFLITAFYLHEDLLSNQSKTTPRVKREDTMQRQYAMAMIKNDFKTWSAFSVHYPPTDAPTRVYALKSKLQIARQQLEDANFKEAAQTLAEILKSKNIESERVIKSIALIEMAYINKKIPGEMIRRDFYEDAVSEMSQLDSENQKLVRNSLHRLAREDWERKDASLQENSNPSN